MTICENRAQFLVLKNFENHKLHVHLVHHSSTVTGTVKCHLIYLPLTRIMNETIYLFIHFFFFIFFLFLHSIEILVVVTFHVC